MGLFSRFENKAEDMIEGSGASRRGGIEPVKLAKRAAKEMEREKMVGVGHEYAPTLYNILLSVEDDSRMNGYYPSLAGEIETYLTSKASESGLIFDCPPLVRFIVDEDLKRGRFDIIAESVSPAIIKELRHEEMVHYGLESDFAPINTPAAAPVAAPQQQSYNYHEPQPQAGFEQAVEETFGTPVELADAAFEPRDDVPRSFPPTNVPEPRPIPEVVQPVPTEGMPESAAPAAVATAAETVMLDEPVPAFPKAALVNLSTRQYNQITCDRTIIGRETTCDIVVGDPSVSRRHAEILHNDSGWLVRDTGSTNGTSVNGTPTTQSRIYNGDIITLGNTQLEFTEG